jgi:hypothetical protein
MKGRLSKLAANFLGVALVLFLAGNQPAGVAQAADSPSGAAATDDNPQGLVNAEKSSAVDITVYGNRFAQVEENRRVQLKAGANRILLRDIATKYRPDSLRVVDARLVKTNVLNPKIADKRKGGARAFTYLSATYQPANLNAEKLLSSSIGKRVKVVDPSGPGSTNVEGKLLNVGSGRAVILTDSGKTAIVPVNYAYLAEMPSGLSNTAALVLEAWADVEGDYELNFLYETDGITWNAKHSLIYDDEKAWVENWESSVAIENDSGTTFEKATVRLLSGNVADGESRMYRSAGGPGGAPRALMADSATVETVGDQKSYTLPGEITLTDGQSRQVPLFHAKNVPVNREYFINASSGYYGSGKREVSIRLEVDNCEKNNLGKPLPAGLVKVYQRNKAGRLQLTGSTNIGHKAADEIFQMVIGTASDIKWERVLVDRQDTTAPGAKPAAPAPAPRAVRPQPAEEQEVWEARTYKFVVYNFKRDRDVQVVVEMNYPTDQTIGTPWKLKESINQAQTTVNVPKSGQSEVKYTVKERVR